MFSDITHLKRKHGKMVFSYFGSKYGIEKATLMLNNFFEKSWSEIPGQDIFEILSLFSSDSRQDEDREILDKLDQIIDNMQKTLNELKVVRKCLR